MASIQNGYSARKKKLTWRKRWGWVEWSSNHRGWLMYTIVFMLKGFFAWCSWLFLQLFQLHRLQLVHAYNAINPKSCLTTTATAIGPFATTTMGSVQNIDLLKWMDYCFTGKMSLTNSSRLYARINSMLNDVLL